MIGYLTPVADPNANCAVSPCGILDDIWTSQECANWLATCNPSSPLIGVTQTQGLLSGAGVGVGEGIANATTGIASGLLTDAEGNINWTMVAIIIALGIVAIDYFEHSR